MPTIKVHPNLSAAADERCSVSGKHSLRFFLFRNSLEMLSGNFVQRRMDRSIILINGSFSNILLQLLTE